MGGLLFVCEGNLCRSPFAELVTKVRLDAVSHGRLGIASAGTRARVGEGVPEPMASLVRENGADPSMHRARQLDAEMLADASLVLVAEGAHRSSLVRLHPPALHYSFTMRHVEHALMPLVTARDEPGALFDATDPGSVSRLVEVLRRGLDRIAADGDDDSVVDPYGRSAATYDRAVLQMRPALDLLVRSFGADGLPDVTKGRSRSWLALGRRLRASR